MISRLNTSPARAPVNASAPTLRSTPHDSGSGWFATPFLYDSFIRYSAPVTGASAGPRNLGVRFPWLNRFPDRGLQCSPVEVGEHFPEDLHGRPQQNPAASWLDQGGPVESCIGRPGGARAGMALELSPAARELAIRFTGLDHHADSCRPASELIFQSLTSCRDALP